MAPLNFYGRKIEEPAEEMGMYVTFKDEPITAFFPRYTRIPARFFEERSAGLSAEEFVEKATECIEKLQSQKSGKIGMGCPASLMYNIKKLHNAQMFLKQVLGALAKA